MFVGVGAVSEEVAFRGFILTGLRQRFRPGTAVLLSSFLFALSQMNVFQFVPHFLLGAVLGFLVLRSGSLWPGIVFHLLYNTLVMGPGLLPQEFAYLGYANVSFAENYVLREVLAGGGLLLVGVILYAIARWTRPPAAVGQGEPVDALPPIDTRPFAPALAASPASTQFKATDQRFHER
jgi:membrane protease YdiL (CAAX protease family)